RFHAFGAVVLGNGPSELTALAGDVAEAGEAFAARPVVHVVEELAALVRRARRRNGADDAAGAGDLLEQAEARFSEVAGDVGNAQRVAQVRLVGAELEHRLLVGNARPFAGLGYGPLAGELLEHTAKHWLDRLKNIFLRDEAHFEIELVELARTTVGARVLVAEAGRNLEIAIEAGDHQQLLEHLRRLRKRVELARMHAARNEVVARAFGAAGGQDRGLELGEALLGHAPAQRGDDLAAEHHVAVDALAPQVEEAVLEADVLGIFLLAGNRHRQFLGPALHVDRTGVDFDVAGREIGIGGP